MDISKTKPKKKHHKQPVFYLKGFTNSEGLLFVYNKDSGNVFESTPEAIAYENDYFTFTNPLGDKDSESFENYIAAIENNTAPVIKKILDEQVITEKEKSGFALFVASMFLRASNFRRNAEDLYAQMRKFKIQAIASDKDKFHEAFKDFNLKEYEKNNPKPIKTLEELRQLILHADEYFKFSTEPLASLQIILAEIDRLTVLFYNMKWCFLKATDNFKFITGDNPVSYGDPTAGLLHKALMRRNTQVTIPLSKKIVAYGTWRPIKESAYIQVKDRDVKGFNRNTVVATEAFVFASFKDPVFQKFVTKHKGSAPAMKWS